jgi:hypothetical protein
MPAITLLIAIALGVLAWDSTAYACSCLPPDLERSYHSADRVVHVRISNIAYRTTSYVVYEAVLVEDAFKGCLDAKARIYIRTARSSATCGITLSAGQEYLIHGRDVASLSRIPTIHAVLCDANRVWSQLSKSDLAFLHSRYNCCGDSCACSDGSQPVNCLIDPCEVSSCDVKGAVCEANYCGGCNAEWHDASGARVCDGSCDYDDPTRRYVARDPALCATILFRCQPGEHPFFDACGCGCGESECGPSACKACASSSQCAAGEHCTTEDGECNRPPGCGPGTICPALCYGTCSSSAR